jgi:hypothetical protein
MIIIRLILFNSEQTRHLAKETLNVNNCLPNTLSLRIVLNVTFEDQLITIISSLKT